MKKKLTLEQLKKKLNVTIKGEITRIYDDYEYVQVLNNSGYLSAGGEYVHRLVAMFHISNPDELPCVNHIDGDKTNNHINNLEWCSYSDNGKHAIQTGLQPVNKGCDHYSTKLTTKQLQSIIDKFVNGDLQKDIAVEFNISASAVSRIVYGVRYKEENLDYSKVKTKKTMTSLLKELTTSELEDLWKEYNGNLSQIAKVLGMSRKTVSIFFNKKGYKGKAGASKSSRLS